MIEYICDGCGLRKLGEFSEPARIVLKPSEWFERSDKDGYQIACSRKCVERVANKSGKTSLVAPI